MLSLHSGSTHDAGHWTELVRWSLLPV